MIRINLLPVRQIKLRIKARNEVFMAAGILILVFIMLGIVGSGQTTQISDLTVKTNQLNSEKTKYQSLIKQIAEIKTKQEMLETKLQVIKDLKTNSQVPVRVLDEMANLTPTNRMWLKTMNFSHANINITGVALDNATIAQYMKRLEISPLFTNAELKNSSLTKVSLQKLKSFTLAVDIKILESPAQTPR